MSTVTVARSRHGPTIWARKSAIAHPVRITVAGFSAVGVAFISPTLCLQSAHAADQTFNPVLADRTTAAP